MTDADGRAQRSDERRGLRAAIALVVVMAAGVATLGLTHAFPSGGARPQFLPANPTVSIDRPLASGPAEGRVYRLTPPPLTLDDAKRIFTAAGVTARVHGGGGSFFAGRNGASIFKTALGWFVSTGSLEPGNGDSSDGKGPPPSASASIAVAGRVLAGIGVPANGARAVRVDRHAGTRTVEVGPRVGGRRVSYLELSVEIGTDGTVTSLSGFLTRITDAGPAQVGSGTSVVDELETPGRATFATDATDGLALWAVTVGTNMMGYTPVFGSSVKYELLGSCGELTRRAGGAIPETQLGFIAPDGRCALPPGTSVHARGSRPTIGIVTVGHGAAFLVPAYRFTVGLSPGPTGGPGVTTITLSAVDAETLARLASNGS